MTNLPPPDCPHCERDSGLYNFRLDCCRIRFLMNEPRLSVRRAWLERWEKFGPIEKLREEVAIRWKGSRNTSASRSRHP